MDDNIFVVFSLQLARTLARKGFEMTGYSVNKKMPQFNVYYFKDSPELQEAVREYKTKKKK